MKFPSPFLWWCSSGELAYFLVYVCWESFNRFHGHRGSNQRWAKFIEVLKFVKVVAVNVLSIVFYVNFWPYFSIFYKYFIWIKWFSRDNELTKSFCYQLLWTGLVEFIICCHIGVIYIAFIFVPLLQLSSFFFPVNFVIVKNYQNAGATKCRFGK